MLKPIFRFTTVVWGEAFTDAFLRATLPSLLTEGNLPTFAKHTNCLYRIYCTTKDKRTICESTAFQKLSAVMPVEMVTVTGINRVGKYQAMTQCHAHFIRSRRHESCAFFFISPDVLWADKSFVRLLEIHATGKRMVAMTSPRLAKESFITCYLEKYGRTDGVEPITPRDLIRLAMSHLHPVTKSQFWEPGFRRLTEPGDIFWRVDETGFLAHSHHLHPVMLRPYDRELVPLIAVDADYVIRACPNHNDIYFVDDSDDICCVDFTNNTDRAEGIEVEQNVESLARALHGLGVDANREFFKRRIRFHSSDLSDRWNIVEEQSDKVIIQIISLLESQPPPPQPSRWRYVSPRFWMRKIDRVSFWGVMMRLYERLANALACKVLGASVSFKAEKL